MPSCSVCRLPVKGIFVCAVVDPFLSLTVPFHQVFREAVCTVFMCFIYHVRKRWTLSRVLLVVDAIVNGANLYCCFWALCKLLADGIFNIFRYFHQQSSPFPCSFRYRQAAYMSLFENYKVVCTVKAATKSRKYVRVKSKSCTDIKKTIAQCQEVMYKSMDGLLQSLQKLRSPVECPN